MVVGGSETGPCIISIDLVDAGICQLFTFNTLVKKKNCVYVPGFTDLGAALEDLLNQGVIGTVPEVERF